MTRSMAIRALGFAVPLVTCLTFLLYVTKFGTEVLFYLLYPGLVVSILITGGHGGSELADKMALVASFLVNTCAYTGLIAILSALRRRRNKRAAI